MGIVAVRETKHANLPFDSASFEHQIVHADVLDRYFTLNKVSIDCKSAQRRILEPSVECA